jgi:hypothetical protein
MNNAYKVESRSCGKQILNLNITREATKHPKEVGQQEYQFSSYVPSMEQEEEILLADGMIKRVRQSRVTGRSS